MFSDFILHRILRRPFFMRVRHDRGPKNPELTIIFIHGIASSYKVWQKAVSLLGSDPKLKNVRLVGIDLIGYGKNKKTKWFKYDYDNYSKSLRYTIKKLRIKTPIILAGHSMGCLISTDYAKKYPEQIKSLVLVSPPFLRPRDLCKVPDQFYIKSYTNLKNNTADPIILAIAGFISKFSSFDRRSFNTPAFQDCMQNIILSEENWEKILKTKLKTFIVHGHLDPLVFGANLRSLAKQNRHIELIQAFGPHDISGAKRPKVISAIKRAVVYSIIEEV